MTKVLFWTEFFWPYIGGIEILSASLLPALRKHGCELTVVTSDGHLDLPTEAEYKGIPIFRLPFRSSLASGSTEQLAGVRRKVARLKETIKPHLFHIMSNGPSVLFHLQTINAYEAPTLVTLQNELLKNKGGVGPDTLMGRLLRAADWVTCVSSEVLAQLRQSIPELSPRSSLIYNGLNPPPLLPASLPVDPPQLLCLGRLVYQKGFDLALRALAALTDRFPNVRMVIAGDGAAGSDLKQQAALLGLKNRIDFIGFVEPERVPAVINAATIVVMPSRKEGLPLVAVEAALMGRPIVGMRVGGLPEVVVHQQTGLLVENEDSQALAEAITFLLEHPETAMQMGRAARGRAQKEFNWERLVDAYDLLYRKLIMDWRGRSSTPRQRLAQRNDLVDR